MTIRKFIHKISKHIRKNEYMSYDNYERLIRAREYINFMTSTARKSLKNLDTKKPK